MTIRYVPPAQSTQWGQQDWYNIPENYKQDMLKTAQTAKAGAGENYGGKWVDYSQAKGWGMDPTPTPPPTPLPPTGPPSPVYPPTTPGPGGYSWPDYPTMDLPLDWRKNVSEADLTQMMRDYQGQQAQWWQKQAEQQNRTWEWQNKLDPQQAWGRWNMEQEANRRANSEEDRQLQMQTSTGYNPYARHGYTNNQGYQRPARVLGR